MQDYRFYRDQLELCEDIKEKANVIRGYVASCRFRNKSIDISNLDLSDTDLSGLNLSKQKVKIPYTSTDEYGTVSTYYTSKTIKVNISNTKLQRANLENCDFGGANMKGTDLTDANIKGANFENAKGVKIKAINTEGEDVENNHEKNKCVMS